METAEHGLFSPSVTFPVGCGKEPLIYKRRKAEEKKRKLSYVGHLAKKEVAPLPARPCPRDPLTAQGLPGSMFMQPRGCSGSHRDAYLPQGEDGPQRPVRNSREEKGPILGVPLFTQQSLLHLQSPLPPTSLPHLALIPRCLNQKFHIGSVSREK